MQAYIATIVLLGTCFALIMAQDGAEGPRLSSCSTTSGSSPCSSSSLCGCATLTSGGNICTHQMNCEFAAPCLPNHTCEKEDNVCVIDPRCPNQTICYSVGLINSVDCPAYGSKK